MSLPAVHDYLSYFCRMANVFPESKTLTSDNFRLTLLSHPEITVEFKMITLYLDKVRDHANSIRQQPKDGNGNTIPKTTLLNLYGDYLIAPYNMNGANANISNTFIIDPDYICKDSSGRIVDNPSMYQPIIAAEDANGNVIPLFHFKAVELTPGTGSDFYPYQCVSPFAAPDSESKNPMAVTLCPTVYDPVFNHPTSKAYSCRGSNISAYYEVLSNIYYPSTTTGSQSLYGRNIQILNQSSDTSFVKRGYVDFREIYNKEWLENFFNVFGIPFRYYNEEVFEDGKKVRHKSLITYEKTEAVKKVRHIKRG